MRNIFVAAIASSAALASASDVYVALGDSVAYGYQPTVYYNTTPTYGDQGYVALVDQYLAAANGGAAPTLVNLAIPDETTSSFFDTSNPYRVANLYYSLVGTPTSQEQLFNEAVPYATSLGDTITTVSYALGANDLLGLFDDPTFLSESTAQQTLALSQTLLTADENNLIALKDIRTELPGAKVIVVGYYNPYDYLPYGNSIRTLTDDATALLNEGLAEDSSFVDGRFVNTFGSFQNNILSYTYMPADVHPNDAGYAAIANDLKSTTAPAPGAAAMMLPGLVALIRRRVRRS